MLMLSHTEQMVANVMTQEMIQSLAKIAITTQARKTRMGQEIDGFQQWNVIMEVLALGDMMMTNEKIAELAYALRVVVDAFEDWSLTDHQEEAIALALHALMITSKEVHKIANEMENEE